VATPSIFPFFFSFFYIKIIIIIMIKLLLPIKKIIIMIKLLFEGISVFKQNLTFKNQMFRLI
jgi:hypothetical protein